jgi:murein DD-endopeptidase MepM/ murein hydrolase activator NlpD
MLPQNPNDSKKTIAPRPKGRRLRWVAIAVAAPLFGMVTAFGTVEDSPPEAVPTRTVVESLAFADIARGDSATSAYFREVRYQSGDTARTLLERLGADDSEADALRRSSQAVRSFQLLKLGTEVQARVGEDGRLWSLSFLTPRDTILSIDRLGDGFSTAEQNAAVERRMELRSGEIRNSLFGATDAAGIPDGVAVQLADIFGGDIDFQRDLRRGDRFSVVYEAVDYLGRAVRSGRVLAAEFTNQRKTYRAVWYQDVGGKGGYYTPDGTNLRRAFLRSPLELSRITSRFGMRVHPFSLQWRTHTGVDYGAPAGTRVRATGDGIVEFAGRRNGYGNLVVLKHHGGFSTYYAHLQGFARSVRGGTRVAQGDIIGYVGQTGWATGPHLHYEFRVHGQYRNPLAALFPAAEPISAQELAAFKRVADPLVARLDLLKNSNLALLE